MKQLILVILILAISISAQENNKGRVSLTFGGEKIDLPINTVTLQKEKTILLTARAELNSENIQQLINIKLSLKDLSTNDRVIDNSNLFLFEFRTRRSKQSLGNVLLLSLDMNNDKSDVQYSERGIQWEMASFHLDMDITEISFLENKLRIKGKFNIESWSKESEEPLKPVVQIKDGKFEIII
ncbi:MAG: hypothetical protein HND52_18065 [Ignavibacteriae bacterium]|nr:hypothetical protein [Ignavibacteriota bacterium]NOG99869.1 hypothetical protein [Ignavibacteriota bacterium]